MKVCATLIQSCRKIYTFCPRWGRDALYHRHQNNDVRRYLAMVGCSDVRQYSTMVDSYDDKFGSGMYAANGYSLYLSQATILDCVERICKRQSAHVPITVADFGTADGRTSLQLLNNVIATTQELSGVAKPVMIYHEDQTNNDFTLLYRVIQGTEDEGQGGLKLSSNVFQAAVGRSMYEQCLPNNSVDISFSSIAVHNLSRRPCRIEGGVSSCDGTEKEKTKIKEQSARDWEQFVYMRGKELSPGGYLVVLNLGADKDGKGVSPIKGGYPQLGKLLSKMLHDGLITQEEFLDANFDVDIYRTEEDHSRPFTQGDRLTQMGLELVSVRSFTNWLEHHTFDIVHKDEATKAEYAERVVAGIKPWFYHVIYNGLSKTRPLEERTRLTDLYFDRMRAFAHDNHGGKTQIPLVETVVRKRL
ncbi:uncharacterized protein LOC117322354 isoform X2 [Pecten maximus]|uniref:uncharacterized protein LOC117322354 isoform X2 n=1 Tax=Pecten maximus TaxID=6579 RepID=UPI0014586A07|nr:uncharacterized protein LOC117322354 isoform X2 [Pecten maximus]